MREKIEGRRWIDLMKWIENKSLKLSGSTMTRPTTTGYDVRLFNIFKENFCF